MITLSKRGSSMAGNGLKHFRTYGKMFGHGVTPTYNLSGIRSFGMFHGGDNTNEHNLLMMRIIDDTIYWNLSISNLYTFVSVVTHSEYL